MVTRFCMCRTPGRGGQAICLLCVLFNVGKTIVAFGGPLLRQDDEEEGSEGWQGGSRSANGSSAQRSHGELHIVPWLRHDLIQIVQGLDDQRGHVV